MENNDVVVTPVVTDVAPVTPAVVPEVVDTNPGHKVFFYVVLGLIAVTGLGLPIVIYLWRKDRKKLKAYETAQAPATEPAQEAATTPEATPENKDAKKK